MSDWKVAPDWSAAFRVRKSSEADDDATCDSRSGQPPPPPPPPPGAPNSSRELAETQSGASPFDGEPLIP
jgi:hypothetical protein